MIDKSYISDYARLLEWYWENYETFIVSWVERRYHPSSWEYEYGYTDSNGLYYPGFLFRHLKYCFTAVEDSKLKDEKKTDELLNEIYRGKSKIMLIVGSRGSGKTAVALWLAQEAHEKAGHKIVYYVGTPETEEIYPKWFRFVSKLAKDSDNEDDRDFVPDKSFAIIDEAAIKYNARRFASDENLDLTDKMVVARHHDITLALITQNVSLLEINVDRLCDIVIYKMCPDYGTRKKKGEMLSQEQKERNIIIKRMKPRNKKGCLIEYKTGATAKFRTFNNPLPTFWDDEKISKSFKNYKGSNVKKKDTSIASPY